MNTHKQQAQAILSRWQRAGADVAFGSVFSARWAIEATGDVATADLDAVAEEMITLTGIAPLSTWR